MNLCGPVPVGVLADMSEGVPKCAVCDAIIEDEGFFDDEGVYCVKCAEEDEADCQAEAEKFALENCKITSKLHRFDPSKRWACSPDEYEMGGRESYTENSVHAHNRHRCTNYDQLLPDRLDKSEWATALFVAVRQRIEKLLQDATDDMYDAPPYGAPTFEDMA